MRDALPTYKTKEKTIQYMKSELNNPSWRTVLVTRHLPAKLSPLERLSKNLWWCWNESAKELFHTIDPDIWHA